MKKTILSSQNKKQQGPKLLIAIIIIIILLSIAGWYYYNTACNTDGEYDCIIFTPAWQRGEYIESGTMKCFTNMGYVLCANESTTCYMNACSCWSNCTFHYSFVEGYPFSTCHRPTSGRERCFGNNKSCHWVY